MNVVLMPYTPGVAKRGGDAIMNRPRIVIAGANSGAGKTTFSLGLMAALQKAGMVVQGYKVGPDYIDPSYHTAITGRASRNLDSFMLTADVVREMFWRSSADADLSVIEGVMGMYDGKDPLSNQGSTAELSVLLQAPVVLVLNVASMARSAAALVLGFQKLDPAVRIAGVLANRVGGEGHYRLVKTAIEQECGVPVLGYLSKRSDIQIPERHLGLIPALERGELQGLFDTLAIEVAKTADLDAILTIARSAPEFTEPQAQVFAPVNRRTSVNVAVARDGAFNFYYPENLELLELYGAKLHFFRPLDGEEIPDSADGLYIGGGFPEEYAAELSSRSTVLENFRRRIADGLPTFAECGGFMFLARSITDRRGATYPMVGVIPARVRMQDNLAALGYREAQAVADTVLLKAGEEIKGHEFHYSTVQYEADLPPHAYAVTGMGGQKQEGYHSGSLLAGYTHLHFASNPAAAERYIDACASYRNQRGKGTGSTSA